MYIKDLTTGIVRKFGTDRHDSLVISDDGKTLIYENLQSSQSGSILSTTNYLDEILKRKRNN